MTNKQTWEIEFDQKIKIEFGSTSPDDIKQFISTKLAEQLTDIEKYIDGFNLQITEIPLDPKYPQEEVGKVANEMLWFIKGSLRAYLHNLIKQD